MNRRNFLRQASGYALAAAGTMTGIGQVFAGEMLLGAASVRLTPYEMEEFDAAYAKIDLMGHRADPFTESQIDK